jgi:hypothetical protein
MSQNQDFLSQGQFNDLEEHIGETVTIFTTSGGESGSGFTGVIINVSNDFVRLVTRIGPPPGCALGNACCDRFNRRWNNGFGNNGFIRSVGSVIVIPLDRIAAVVFNSV